MKKLTLTLGLLMALLVPAIAGATTKTTAIAFNADNVSNIKDRSGNAISFPTADTEISYFELTDPETEVVFKITLDVGNNACSDGPLFPKIIASNPLLRIHFANTMTIETTDGIKLTNIVTACSSNGTYDRLAKEWSASNGTQTNANANLNVPINWAGYESAVTFEIITPSTGRGGSTPTTGIYGQGITSFTLTYEGDFTYDPFKGVPFSMGDITPSTSTTVDFGGGAKAFNPVLSLVRKNQYNEVAELEPNTCGLNPNNFANNVSLRYSKDAVYDDDRAGTGDSNIRVTANADNTMIFNIPNLSLYKCVSVGANYIFLVVPADYFRCRYPDGTYQTLPEEQTVYRFPVSSLALSGADDGIYVTLPTESDKTLRFGKTGCSDASTLDFTLVITNTNTGAVTAIKEATFENGELVYDMSMYRSGNYNYNLSEGSVVWIDADGGQYVNDGITGSIPGFEGASYFDNFTVSINGYTRSVTGGVVVYSDVPVGRVYYNGQKVGLGEFVLTAPEGVSLEGGNGYAELLYSENDTDHSFPTPIRWTADDIIFDTDGEGNATNVARLAGPSVGDLLNYNSFKLVVPAGFVNADGSYNEYSEIMISTVLGPTADIYTVDEEEVDNGKVGVLKLSPAYKNANITKLPGFKVIVGYSISYTDASVDAQGNKILQEREDGSIVVNHVITNGQQYYVTLSDNSFVATDANGNWTFNNSVSASVSCQYTEHQGFRYEAIGTGDYDTCNITRIDKNNIVDGVLTVPAALVDVQTNYGKWTYKIVGISADAFKACGDVKTVILPEANLANIYADAFKGATSLETVYMQKVPAVANGAFNGVPEDCKIYVPATANVNTLGGRAVEKANMVFETSTSATLEDGYTYLSFTEKNIPVTYNRDFTGFDNTWQVLFVPHAMETASLNGKVAQLERVYVENGTRFVEWKVVNGTLEANKPYLFKPASSGKHAMTGNGVVSHTNVGSASESCGDFEITLTGVYAAQDVTVGDGNYYMYSDGNFHPAGVASTLKPFRVFLTINEKSGAQAPKQLYNVLNDGTDTPTVIGELPVEVLKSGVYYDLQGREVQNPERGIYILNGRKVVIK